MPEAAILVCWVLTLQRREHGPIGGLAAPAVKDGTKIQLMTGWLQWEAAYAL
jgi:hypothetical protein